MNMTGLLFAAVVIGAIGIVIGVLLSGKSWSGPSCRAITAAAADSPAVTGLRMPSLPAPPR